MAARWGIVLVLLAVLCASVPGGHVEAGRLYQGGIPLTFGKAVTGTIDDTVFRQVYTFEGHAGAVITIQMSRNEGDLDPFLLLTDERGAILAISDDQGSGMDALIASKNIPADGNYFVIATRFGQEHGSSTGAYSLLVERVGVGATSTTSVRYGENVFGRITASEPRQFYFLRAQRGDVLHIWMQRTSGSLDPQLDLATPDGRILISNDDDPMAEGTLDAGINNYTVLETGVYLVVATRFGREAGDTEGSFALTVSQVPPEELGTRPEAARLVDYGAVVEGTIEEELSARYYWFEGQRGDVITVSLQRVSGNLDPLIRLADAALNQQAIDDNSGDQNDARIAAYTLPDQGTYYLIATRAGEATGRTTGSYLLQLTGRPGIAGGEALEIVYGATVSGRIDDQRSAEEYVFFGQRGDVIEITMERVSDNLDALITLLDGERKQIFFDDDGAGDQNARVNDFVLPYSGMYVIVASRFERETGGTSGAYMLSLELVRSGG